MSGNLHDSLTWQKLKDTPNGFLGPPPTDDVCPTPSQGVPGVQGLDIFCPFGKSSWYPG